MSPKLWFDSANRWLVAVLTVLMLTANASAAWTEKVLYSFQGGSDGYTPAGGVVFDSAGNLYGANSWGGSGGCASPGCGTVFEISPPSQQGGAWTETTIYAFQGVQGGANDGFTPVGGVIIDKEGNLYGTTSLGGSGSCVLLGSAVGCGTVYELSPPTQQGGSWTETILYNFQGGNDGYFPWGNLVFDKKGNVYGATQFGGGKGTTCNMYYGGNCGTVFELRPPKQKGGAWTEKVLYGFAGGTKGQRSGDGANPNGGLILDSKGSIYGTTYFGGDEAGTCDVGSGGTGCGIVFELVPPKKMGGAWTEKRLYLFRGGNNDGGNSAAGVVARGGNLYGTTEAGAPDGWGIVFELKKPSSKGSSWRETILHFFTNGTDGILPQASLIFDGIGDLYGTASGGKTHLGVVFQMKPPKHGNFWLFTTLYNFTGSPDGSHPAANVIFDGSGNLYGTTVGGGTGGDGTVFEVSP
jgi:uncharacterized repeat protein (TIGR03803 family)